MLQPHEGSSETARVREETPESRLLQPYEGSSETRSVSTNSTALQGFNPTRVRLKRFTDGLSEDVDIASTPRGFV